MSNTRSFFTVKEIAKQIKEIDELSPIAAVSWAENNSLWLLNALERTLLAYHEEKSKK